MKKKKISAANERLYKHKFTNTDEGKCFIIVTSDGLVDKIIMNEVITAEMGGGINAYSYTKNNNAELMNWFDGIYSDDGKRLLPNNIPVKTSQHSSNPLLMKI
jgi:hypothetical protein